MGKKAEHPCQWKADPCVKDSQHEINLLGRDRPPPGGHRLKHAQEGDPLQPTKNRQREEGGHDRDTWPEPLATSRTTGDGTRCSCDAQASYDATSTIPWRSSHQAAPPNPLPRSSATCRRRHRPQESRRPKTDARRDSSTPLGQSFRGHTVRLLNRQTRRIPFRHQGQTKKARRCWSALIVTSRRCGSTEPLRISMT